MIYPKPISAMLADLYRAIDERRGWSLVRLGDGESRLLQGAPAPFDHLENYITNPVDVVGLRQATVCAVKGADWVGWHQDHMLCSIMAAYGMTPIENSQYAWVNLHMGLWRGFVEKVLRQEKLFLAGATMQRWQDEVLRPAGLGSDAVVWRGKTSLNATGEAERILDALSESDCTVALFSLGVWALWMADMAKLLGLIGIDWGHAPDHHLFPTCEEHRERYEGAGPCADPECQAHWRYRLN
ncbi:MAG: hypothetical protein WC241_04965, partial [Candidatus Paceibacterota bacterium]